MKHMRGSGKVLGRVVATALGVGLLPVAVYVAAQSDPTARSEDAPPPPRTAAPSASTFAGGKQDDANAQSPPSTTTGALPASTTTADTLPAPPTPSPTRESADARAGVAADSLLRAQVLLERAHFSTGEIDGVSGPNTRRAVAAFQRARGLPDDGVLNAATWAALEADAAPATVMYALSADDVAGPFAPVPSDMMEKAKLQSLGYVSVTEALAERFRVAPALLRRLNPAADFAAGQAIVVPNVLDLGPLPKAASVVVDRSESTVALVDAAGKVYAQFPASTGSDHDPLPVGEWKINGVAHEPTFHYNPELFWDADPGHAKAKIPAGPNNPVGVVWIDLSKEHYGIHGTPEPSRIGKTQSHGCIRLTNWSAREVATAVAAGTPARLQE
ncbi:L,D-transpeptidase family protein [Aerolutibacter daejeonensis]|uniref:L,D-transpeptidase family protein n=1 Tax=Aerolutibacter daejeonensis TaxID=346181 RepID=UPI002FBE6E78